jgi:nicotinamidase-related amidase
MATAILAPKTALLLLDFQNIHLDRIRNSAELISRASEAVGTARKHNVLVVHCRIALTTEESANLPPCFERLKADPAYLAKMHVDAPTSQFHSSLAPQDGDLVFIKKRVGPFRNAPQDLDTMLAERGIDSLVVGGIATGGAVLSTVLEAADLDYKLFVLEDACADPVPETQSFLINFLRKRANVIKCSDLEALVA